MEGSILGISPGTRHVGIAIIQKGELIDSRVWTFKGPWSELKSLRIQKKISMYIELYSIRKVVLKRFHARRLSPELADMIAGIHELLAECNLKAESLTIDEIKDHLLSEGLRNKQNLGKALIRYYPELSSSIRLQKKYQRPYHEMEFEAVGLAHIVMNWNRR